MWTLPELHYTPNRYHLKVQLLAIVQERIPWALIDPTHVLERSAEIKPENRREIRAVLFNIISSSGS